MINNYYLKNENHSGYQLKNLLKIVQSIKAIHDEFDKKLEDCIKNWNSKPYIFDIFEEYLPKFLYEEYIKNFQSGFQCLIDLIDKSKSFSQYLNSQNEIVYSRMFSTIYISIIITL